MTKDIMDAVFIKEMAKTTSNLYRLGWDEETVAISLICWMKKKLWNI